MVVNWVANTMGSMFNGRSITILATKDRRAGKKSPPLTSSTIIEAKGGKALYTSREIYISRSGNKDSQLVSNLESE